MPNCALTKGIVSKHEIQAHAALSSGAKAQTQSQPMSRGQQKAWRQIERNIVDNIVDEHAGPHASAASSKGIGELLEIVYANPWKAACAKRTKYYDSDDAFLFETIELDGGTYYNYVEDLIN